jgi:hypothetical protein
VTPQVVERNFLLNESASNKDYMMDNTGHQYAVDENKILGEHISDREMCTGHGGVNGYSMNSSKDKQAYGEKNSRQKSTSFVAEARKLFTETEFDASGRIKNKKSHGEIKTGSNKAGVKKQKINNKGVFSFIFTVLIIVLPIILGNEDVIDKVGRFFFGDKYISNSDYDYDDDSDYVYDDDYDSGDGYDDDYDYDSNYAYDNGYTYDDYGDNEGSDDGNSSDGYLFDYGNYGNYAENSDTYTAIDLDDVLEDDENCDVYGHYEAVDARDFMDGFYAECKSDNVDIQYLDSSGQNNLYETTDGDKCYDSISVFANVIEKEEGSMISWDRCTYAIHAIMIWTQVDSLEDELADDDSELRNMLTALINQLGDDNIDESIIESACDNMVNVTDKYVEGSDEIKYGTSVYIGQWKITAALNTGGEGTVSLIFEAVD